MSHIIMWICNQFWVETVKQKQLISRLNRSSQRQVICESKISLKPDNGNFLLWHKAIKQVEGKCLGLNQFFNSKSIWLINSLALESINS